MFLSCLEGLTGNSLPASLGPISPSTGENPLLASLAPVLGQPAGRSLASSCGAGWRVPFPLGRLVHSGAGHGSPRMGSDLTFATRTGTRQGIEMHVFRAETQRDLSSWTRTLVQGCHSAAELIKEVSLGTSPAAALGSVALWGGGGGCPGI